MIVFGAIAPHGNPAFEEGETRRAMVELARRLHESGAEAAIVVTPHGTFVDDHIAVVRSTALAEQQNQFVADEYLYEGPGDPELADACISALREEGFAAAGLLFGTSYAGGSVMPIDWGAGIPLWFLRIRAVAVTPNRALPNAEQVRAGAALARGTGERKVAFVASADHGHGHGHDGPYGHSAQSKPYDDQVVDVVQRNALHELVDWDAQFARDAMADSFWQMLMLHGALGDGFDAELLSYEVPTYFGMLTAFFTPAT